jgi:DNA mismatch repair protein MutS
MTYTETRTSPMMLQWEECKSEASGAVLLFRLGDFYEAFHDDALLCARELDLTLTKRQNIPMSGIPSCTLENYIDKLVSKGHRVAIAEQVEDPKLAKGLVKRALTRIITPGTLLNSSLLSEKSHNYIASIIQIEKKIGIAFLDVGCLDCRVIEVESWEEAFCELYRFKPKEVLTTAKVQNNHPDFFKELKNSLSCLIDFASPWKYDLKLAHGFLLQQFQVQTLDGFGLKGMTAAISAAGGLLSYVQENLRLPLGPIQAILPYSLASHMSIDKTTMKNLELIESPQNGSKTNTLLSVLDHTATPMGGRLLKRWILQPLLEQDSILQRLDAVEDFITAGRSADKLQEVFANVRDLERLITKVAAGYAGPRDVSSLKASLEPISKIKQDLASFHAPLIQTQKGLLNELQGLIQLISDALVDEPPLRLSDGGAFRKGYDRELDELKALSFESKTWMNDYQNSLKEATGIKTLKVGFTKVSGFYIEVSKGQADKVPSTLQRRQTLTNAERFTTEELKKYEEKILNAEDKITEIESSLFYKLKLKTASFANEVLANAKAIGNLDCLISLSIAARKNRYCRPSFVNENSFFVREGRHPVIETACIQEKFIPNDISLDVEKNRLMLITGPNMAGKSTYIRSIALIAIMAQMGSFVPAAEARIGLIDKVFSRIGASDDISRGQSTFMVEMIETAAILHQATSRSLIILDEIGRGTSTYDGISLAWSIAEYLLTTPGKVARTLFATHYWELTKLEEKVPGAVNFHVAVHEGAGQILFLRKILRGGTDKSYGIHVAKLAGLPSSVLARAEEILQHLEETSTQKKVFDAPKPKRLIKQRPLSPEVQLNFFIDE